MNNQEIRKKARKAKVPFWKIADALNVSEATFTRKLRRELPDDEKARIFAIIEELKEGAQNVK